MAKEPLVLTPLGEILAKTFAEFDNWLIKDLIPLEDVTIVSGAPSNFKSYICQHLALCVASGKSFLGYFEIPSFRKVIYFDKEARLRKIQERFKALGAASDPYIEINRDNDFYLDNDEDVDRLIQRLKEPEYIATGLVVFDSLIRFHRKNENSAVEMAIVTGNARRIASTGTAVLLLQHSRKEFGDATLSPNSMRGSIEILAGIDTQFSIAHDKKQDVISFVNHKMRDAAWLDPFAVKIIRENDDRKGKPIGFEHSGAYDKDKPKLEEIKDTLIDLFKERNNEFSREDIHVALGDDYSKALANKAVEALVDERYFSRRTTKGNKRLYSRIKQEGEIIGTSVDNSVDSSL